MADKYTDINIEELLPRYSEGTTTQEETKLVEEWMENDATRRKMVDQIRMLNLATDTMHVMQSVNTEKALRKVKSRINIQTISWWEWTQRIASLLFIPLLIATLVLYADRNSSKEVAQMIEVKTNPGMTTSVTLPDSTVVFLNSESTLRYPSHFNREIREVTLIGEAYFNVAKDKTKRFIVSTPHQSKIEVYGTSFNVEAYTTDNRILTTLVEGQVGFLFKDENGDSRKIVLTPNHKLIYQPASGKVKMYETTCESEIAWTEGTIIFNNTPMKEVLSTLSKRFNVEFVIKNKKLEEYSFTSTFDTQRLDRILEFFKRSSQIQWRYLDSDEMIDKKQRIEIY